jgi:hypothetical protein
MWLRNTLSQALPRVVILKHWARVVFGVSGKIPEAKGALGSIDTARHQAFSQDQKGTKKLVTIEEDAP